MNYTVLQGFTFIEVLISLILLSLILLGLDAMAIQSLRESKSAYLFYVAVNQVRNMTERLVALSTYEGLTTEIQTWNAENKIRLPNGRGEVLGLYPDYTIKINWGNETRDCTAMTLGFSGCIIQKIVV